MLFMLCWAIAVCGHLKAYFVLENGYRTDFEVSHLRSGYEFCVGVLFNAIYTLITVRNRLFQSLKNAAEIIDKATFTLRFVLFIVSAVSLY